MIYQKCNFTSFLRCIFITISLIWLSPSFAVAGEDIELRLVSSSPETVSGGSALVTLSVPKGTNWTAFLNDADVTKAFQIGEGSNDLTALLTGLHIGKNLLTIRAEGQIRAELVLRNHPLSGPIFSGPHQTPWVCQTEMSGLGAATDEACSAATIVQYYYRGKDIPLRGLARLSASLAAHDWPLGFKPLDPAKPLPSDIATTTTSTGQTVPFIVRRETGTLNRGIYRIEFLHRPGDPLPSPWAHPDKGWNGQLVYAFGGGCAAGYRQGSINAISEENTIGILSDGYAIATSSLNTMQTNCNYVLSAETLSMVKEYFIKQFGSPAHVIGVGFSHGAAQQFLIAQNYPGLLDGLVAGGGGSEIWMPYFQSPADCALLDHAFDALQNRYTDQQKAAISGFASWRTCTIGWPNFIIDPKCDASVPAKLVYDRRRNAAGIRCDLFNNAINVFGRDASTGQAQRTFDNVGVQYGLEAFNSGVIDAEQFIALNHNIGGIGAENEFSAERSVASEAALDVSQASGMVLRGDGPIRDIPIIDWVNYRDDLNDAHDLLRRFSRRARFDRDGGRSDNQVILVFPRIEFAASAMEEGLPPLLNPAPSLVRTMSRWLDATTADTRAGSRADIVSRNRPAELYSACFAASGEKIPEAPDDAASRCRTLYPLHGNPRIAAGGPLADDVLKCTLKPVRRSDYRGPFTDAQFSRLRRVFPAGVCDYRGGNPKEARRVSIGAR